MADYASVLTGGTNSFPTTSEHLNALATDILSEGVVGAVGNTAGVAPMTGGLACNAQGTPNMTVAVTAGYCYVTTTPSGQASQLLRANIAAQNATIAANSTGGTRYDWIYVAMSAANAANPAVGGDDVASITVSRSTSSSTDNGTPPTYGYPIAVVTVANGAASITNGNITDLRTSLAVSNNSSDSGWTNLGSTPDTITNNGNGYYDLVFNSVDHTDTLGSGSKLKIGRTVTAPTQCTDLESSSSQYFSKSSPGGMTFTDDFTCMAWVKPESVGTQMRIIGRISGTNGWHFGITAAGILYIEIQPGAGTTRSVVSYISIPVGEWTHVAASMDASGASTLMYINGVLTDSTSSGAATSLTQGGDLQVGSANTTNYFDGKLAQVAVFSSVLSAATIRSYMSQALSGSESTIVSAYSFNNSIVDLNTSNANNLSANNSAVATDTDSPFAARKTNSSLGGITAGTTEFARIISVSYSTNTTITVKTSPGCAIPTSGGISAVSYSNQDAPYGWPASSNKILAKGVYGSTILVGLSGAATGNLNGTSFTVYVPEGAFIRLSALMAYQNDTANAVGVLRIAEGSTYLAISNLVNDVGNQQQYITIETVIQVSGGSHTYKLFGGQSGGNAYFQGGQAAPQIGHFVVELI